MTLQQKTKKLSEGVRCFLHEWFFFLHCINVCVSRSKLLFKEGSQHNKKKQLRPFVNHLFCHLCHRPTCMCVCSCLFSIVWVCVSVCMAGVRVSLRPPRHNPPLSRQFMKNEKAWPCACVCFDVHLNGPIPRSLARVSHRRFLSLSISLPLFHLPHPPLSDTLHALKSRRQAVEESE